MLNIKQERFVQNIVNGMSQRQAYKEAYNAKYSDKSIDEHASTLFNSEKVQERYKELLSKIEDKAIMSAIDRMKWLSNVINNKEFEEDNDGFKPADLNTKMKAMDILNKMDGQYVTKVDANVDSDVTIDIKLGD